jgi:hypothetical protein
MKLPTVGTAIFDETERYRYVLTRELDRQNKTCLLAVCLNPSTATADVNDPTVRRLMGYTLAWGFGSLTVCNIFAFRGTDPRSLYKAEDPIGDENDEYICEQARMHDLVLCGWGNHGCEVKGPHGDFTSRGSNVRQLLEEAGIQPMVFGLSGKLQPLHPLYLANDMPAIPWDSRARERTVAWQESVARRRSRRAKEQAE